MAPPNMDLPPLGESAHEVVQYLSPAPRTVAGYNKKPLS